MTTKLLAGFWNTVTSNPDATALMTRTEIISYGDLGKAVRTLAQYLDHHLNVTRRRVLIVGEREPSLFLALLATWSTGAAATILRPSTGAHRLNHVLKVIQPTAVLSCGSSAVELLSQHFENAQVISNNLAKIQLYHQQPRDPQPVQETYIVTTSGTTGDPKFIPITLDAVLHFMNVTSSRIPIETVDRATQLFEPTFDLFYFDVLMTLNAGAALVIIREEEIWSTVDICADAQVTLWFSVPSLAFMLEATGRLQRQPLPPLRRIFFCGEALPVSLAQAWASCFPSASIENLYGPAEATIACTYYPFTTKDSNDTGIVPIGKANTGLSIMLRNSEGHLQEYGDGELCVAGPQLMQGYLPVPGGSPPPDPFIREGHVVYYRTGDHVEAAPGKPLLFKGRIDRQFKYAGRRMQSEEIEAVISSLPEVAEVVVIPEIENGNGMVSGISAFWRKRMAENTQDISEITLRIQHVVEEKLGRHYIPTKIIHVDHIPKNINGKVDYSAIEHYSSSSEDTSQPVLPASSAMQLIAATLAVPINELSGVVGIHDHPRWDSLGHIAIVSRLSEKIGGIVRPEGCLTIAEIEKLLSGHKSEEFARFNIRRGLHGIYLDRTSISEVNHSGNRLSYRSHDIQALTEMECFVDVAILLNSGKMPQKEVQQQAKFQLLQGHSCPVPIPITQGPPITAMAASLLTASNDCNQVFQNHPVVAAMWTIGRSLAALGATQATLEQGIASALLEAHGVPIDGQLQQILENGLIIFAEHGACASTTALRCAVSSGATPSHALSVALATFDGPLHGGSVREVARLLCQDGGMPGHHWHKAVAQLDQGVVLPGFGHRIYQTEDPRSSLMKRLLIGLPNGMELMNAVDELANDVAIMTNGRLFPNIDLFGACVLNQLGFDPEAMPSVFATARMAGWVAHLFEQTRHNVLIRPHLLYDPTFDSGTSKKLC